MRIRIISIAAVLALTTWLPGGASGAKSSSSINVTATVHDYDASGAQLLMRSDDYNGTGQAAYSATLNANVQSYIFTNGAWYLRLYNQSVRTLYLTPDDAINSSQPLGPPPGYYWQNVEVAVGCYDQNLNVVPFQNILTSSNNCKMIVDFGYNGTQYKLVMGPSGTVSGPAPGLVTVSCNAVSSGQCVSWTIVPNTSSPNPTVADLFKPATHTNSGFVGQYYWTFRIDMTNP